MFKIKKQKEFEKYKKIVEKSGLFDSRYYLRAYSDVRRASETPIDHFIKVGLMEDRKPNSLFDPVWYREFYDDIKNSKEIPFIHYIIYGQKEFRFANASEKELYEQLQKSFDTVAYKSSYEDLHNLGDDYDLLWHYVHFGKNEGRVFQEKDTIPVQTSVMPKEVPQISSDELSEEQKYEYHIIHTEGINFSDYFAVNQHPFVSEDPILDYIINWKNYQPTIKGIFSTRLYLRLYPDINNAGINPLVHFLTSGREERRIGYISPDNYIVETGISFDEKKETLVFISHESSASGAPLLAFNIINSLLEYNIIHIILKKSDIHNLFYENSFLVIENIDSNPIYIQFLLEYIQDKYKTNISIAILNSSVVSIFLDVMNRMLIPSVFLIHEFSQYTRPLGRMSQNILKADMVVVPANIILSSIKKELKDLYSYHGEPLNIKILNQGKLPIIAGLHGKNTSKDKILEKLKIKNREKFKIICGAGQVHIRKGVDLFISLAYKIKQKDPNTKFIWVGDGYAPEEDMVYSVWLKKQLEANSLSEDFIFLDHQKDLSNVFALSDFFCLTSRMDPFPNVVIDALESNLPIACFEDSTGSLEFLEKHNANYVCAPYADVDALASVIVNYDLDQKENDIKNKELVATELKFDKYMTELRKIINITKMKHKYHLELASNLLGNNYVKTSFYTPESDSFLSALHYVRTSKHGLGTISGNPLPEFNQNLWILNNEYKSNIPLFDAIENNTINPTHKNYNLPISDTHIDINMKVAVHLHLYYSELSNEFFEYFKNIPIKFTLFITIVDSDDKKYVIETFSKLPNLNKLKVLVVENIGRDVAPLIMNLKDEIFGKFDIVGHFHSKKSLSTDSDMGNRWRKYLLDNLIGDKKGGESIFSILSDKKIGLLFPSDHHAANIGKNREFIYSLCKKMSIDTVDDTPIFPLGNMYWARVDAIKQLFELGKDILQEEPLPYDGSYMHAIERITPHLVKQNGFEYITVWREGTTW